MEKILIKGEGGGSLTKRGGFTKRSKRKKKGTGERGRGHVLGAVEYKRVQCRFEI